MLRRSFSVRRSRSMRSASCHTLAAVAAVAILLTVAASHPVSAAAPGDAPEGVIRAFFMAMYAGDAPAVERLTLPDPRRATFIARAPRYDDRLRELREDPDALQIRVARPFALKGRPVQPDAAGIYPAGTTVRYAVTHRIGPIAISLVNGDAGWRVDLRWLLAMMELERAESGPKQGTPDYAARALTAALLKLDRAEAAKHVAPGGDPDLLFAGAPSRREPSGHRDAMVLEMPLVEIGPGEFTTMPTNRVVEGSSSTDRKVLVGLFGSVELPFVLRRVGADWKVETEPYFLLLKQ